MATFLDETFEEQESRENLEQFYGKYSSDVRKRLLSKNVKKPDNIYDVLYSPIRRDLLSKNSPNLIDLDKSSEEIRNRLLSKQIENDINLDRSGENIRKSLLSKNGLLQSTLDLEKIADSSRKNLVSKNEPNKDATPEAGSKKYRRNLESKNTPNDSDLEESSEDIRHSQLSKNVEIARNIDKIAASQRNNLVSKNVPNNKSIDAPSDAARKNLLSKNVPTQNDLDSSSDVTRKSLLSKNNDESKNIDDSAEQARNNLLASNQDKESTLDADSEKFRHNLESKNKPEESTLDLASENSRKNLLSKNENIESTIDSVSESARKNLLSKNPPNENDIDKSSDTFRDNLLSKNVSTEGNLDKSGEQARDKLESSNVPSGADPETGAEEIRDSLLSKNVPNDSDLDGQSQEFRDGLLASNVPNGANPETGSDDTRDSLLASNVPSGANPETGADDVRDDLLSSNVPNGANPEGGADDVRDNLLSSNVPSGANPETGADDVRDDLLSSNVPNGANPETGADDTRDNLLSHNIPNGANPTTGAKAARLGLLSKNVPNGANPEDGADDVRDDLLSSNVPTNVDLSVLSKPTRDDLLSANVPNNTNVDALAVPIRDNLLSKNVENETDLEDISNPFRHNLLSKNETPDTLGANIILNNGTSQFIGISNLDVIGEITRQANKLKNIILNGESNNVLQKSYGMGGTREPDSTGQGSEPSKIGAITFAAQLSNTEINTFSLNHYAQGSKDGFTVLSEHNTDGFQELLTTIGYQRKAVQVGTNTTPPIFIEENKGQYLPLGDKGIDQILKEGQEGEVGSALSMMSQTIPSDAIEESFYNKKNRGVQHVMNTIRNSNNIELAKNYDSQKSKSFTIGNFDPKTSGRKKAYQRYTIENPYRAPLDTGVLELRLTNYAIPKSDVRTMSFPPYVKSFVNNDSASWNETLFLGRPEPIYTYSNSKRDGTLEFMILTDYAQTVDVGVDWKAGEDAETIAETFDNHFTDGGSKISDEQNLESRIRKETDKLSELSLKKSQIKSGNDVSGIASLDKEIRDVQSSISSLQDKLNKIISSPGTGAQRLYSEVSEEASNIYQSILDGIPEPSTADGTLSSSPSDTISKLGDMKQKLLFQPAFFSGDKVDFLNRLEFIAKLTRPSRNNAPDGFSFTKPPVCHLHLGSWINHDIIINSVSYNYADAPWTLDEGRVQPMWVTVSISFNIIGTYGGISTESVPLATDTGGFFQRKTS